MNGSRAGMLLVILTVWVATSGATCNYLTPQQDDVSRLGPALPPSPSLEQVIQVVNANTDTIRTFSTTQATLSGPGMPSLRASVAFERQRRFRLVAETGITGPEVDLGSNDEVFWFWVRRNQPAALYYCRHDQFAQSPARGRLPIEPSWLIEALGVIHLDPAASHQGPYPWPGGRLAIYTSGESPQGPTTKTTVIDPTRGVVVEQHLYDARRQLIASATTSRFRRDPLSGLYMPMVVDLRSPPNGFAMQINLGNVEINRPLTAGGSLWSVPNYQGWPAVDLCNLPQQPAAPAYGARRQGGSGAR